MKWFFYYDEGARTVRLRARVEAAGAIGDAFEDVKEDGSFAGISFELMREADAGTIILDEHGKGVMESPESA